MPVLVGAGVVMQGGVDCFSLILPTRCRASSRSGRMQGSLRSPLPENTYPTVGIPCKGDRKGPSPASSSSPAPTEKFV